MDDERVVGSLNATLAAKLANKYDSNLDLSIREWISGILQDNVIKDCSIPLSELLHDGTCLCSLANKLKPGSVRINQSTLAFKQMENISNYLTWCTHVGLSKGDLFQTIDLFEVKDMNSVLNNINSLRHLSSKHNNDLTSLPAKQRTSAASTPPSSGSSPSSLNSPPSARRWSSTAPPMPSSPLSTSKRSAFLSTADPGTAPSVSTLEDDVKTKEEFKYSRELEQSAKDWIQKVLDDQTIFSSASFASALKSGTVLLRLIQKLYPNQLTYKINDSKFGYRQLENLGNYIKACFSIGLQPTDLFDTPDLYDEKNINLVISSIHILAKHVAKSENYNGPKIRDTKQVKTLFSASIIESSSGDLLPQPFASEPEPENEEQRELVAWMNRWLAKDSPPPTSPIKNLSTSVKSGVPIIRLCILLTKALSVGAYVSQPKTLWHCMQNASLVLRFLAENTFSQTDHLCKAQDIVLGSSEPVSLLLKFLRDKFDLDYLFFKALNEGQDQQISLDDLQNFQNSDDESDFEYEFIPSEMVHTPSSPLPTGPSSLLESTADQDPEHRLLQRLEQARLETERLKCQEKDYIAQLERARIEEEELERLEAERVALEAQEELDRNSKRETERNRKREQEIVALKTEIEQQQQCEKEQLDIELQEYLRLEAEKEELQRQSQELLLLEKEEEQQQSQEQRYFFSFPPVVDFDDSSSLTSPSCLQVFKFNDDLDDLHFTSFSHSQENEDEEQQILFSISEKQKTFNLQKSDTLIEEQVRLLRQEKRQQQQQQQEQEQEDFEEELIEDDSDDLLAKEKEAEEQLQREREHLQQQREIELQLQIEEEERLLRVEAERQEIVREQLKRLEEERLAEEAEQKRLEEEACQRQAQLEVEEKERQRLQLEETERKRLEAEKLEREKKDAKERETLRLQRLRQEEEEQAEKKRQQELETKRRQEEELEHFRLEQEKRDRILQEQEEQFRQQLQQQQEEFERKVREMEQLKRKLDEERASREKAEQEKAELEESARKQRELQELEMSRERERLHQQQMLAELEKEKARREKEELDRLHHQQMLRLQKEKEEQILLQRELEERVQRERDEAERILLEAEQRRREEEEETQRQNEMREREERRQQEALLAIKRQQEEADRQAKSRMLLMRSKEREERERRLREEEARLQRENEKKKQLVAAERERKRLEEQQRREEEEQRRRETLQKLKAAREQKQQQLHLTREKEEMSAVLREKDRQLRLYQERSEAQRRAEQDLLEGKARIESLTKAGSLGNINLPSTLSDADTISDLEKMRKIKEEVLNKSKADREVILKKEEEIRQKQQKLEEERKGRELRLQELELQRKAKEQQSPSKPTIPPPISAIVVEPQASASSLEKETTLVVDEKEVVIRKSKCTEDATSTAPSESTANVLLQPHVDHPVSLSLSFTDQEQSIQLGSDEKQPPLSDSPSKVNNDHDGDDDDNDSFMDIRSRREYDRRDRLQRIADAKHRMEVAEKIMKEQQKKNEEIRSLEAELARLSSLKQQQQSGGSKEVVVATTNVDGSWKIIKKKKLVGANQPSLVDPSSSSSGSEERRSMILRDEGTAMRVIKAQNTVRKKILNELLETERSYVNSLGLINQFLIEPILSSAKKGPRILKDSEYVSAFSNLHKIYQNHQSFFVLLEKRVAENANDESSAIIGDLFLQRASLIEDYGQYLANYDLSLLAVHFLAQKYEKFQTLIKSFEKSQLFTTKLDLSSYLIMPVQRLPRYTLLLRDLLKYTNKTHPDYELISQAVAFIQAALGRHNKNIDPLAGQQTHKLLSVNASVGNLEEFNNKEKNGLLLPGRKFVREGEIQLKKHNTRGGSSSRSSVRLASLDFRDLPGIGSDSKRQPDYCFMFNDLLLFCEQVSSEENKKLGDNLPYRYADHLSMLEVREIKASERYANKLRITLLNKSVWTLKVDPIDRPEWETELKKCLAEIQK